MRKFRVISFPPFTDFFKLVEPKHSKRNVKDGINFIRLRQLKCFCDNKNNYKFPYI